MPVLTAAHVPAGSWDWERGRIDAAMLSRHLGGLAGPIYYVAGPAGMVVALRVMDETT